MTRRCTLWLLSMAKRLVDDTVSEADLHAFMRQKLTHLDRALQSGATAFDADNLAPIFDCVDRLHRLGFTAFPEFNQPLARHREHPIEEAQDSSIPVVSGGRIESGAVRELRYAVDREGLTSEVQVASLEALLRHIEVRRKAGLHFVDSNADKARWPTVCGISVVFSRHARQGRDYRYLNTALKLNDWAYRHYRSVRALQSSLPFLQAVLEAETTLLEMTS